MPEGSVTPVTQRASVDRKPTWQCEVCGRFYSERTANDHGYCLQEEDRRNAESSWPNAR